MSDNLSIFGATYSGVTKIKATNTSGVTQTYYNTSDGNAEASNILSGKTAYTSAGQVTGTMAFKTAQTYTPGTTNQIINSN